MERSKRNKVSDVKSEQRLVEAAGIGDLKTLLKLINAGTSVDAEDHNRVLFYASKNYMTPLQMACANGHSTCAEVLISHGADVDAKDRFDVTAMHMAAEKGHIACLKALLNANAECSHPTKFSKIGCYTAVPYRGGTTPLHLAAANNRIDCVEELMQYGGDYNAVDELGRTSLYIAAQLSFGECVLAHLRNAVGRDILSLPSFDTRETPLHFAVSRGMVDCVSALLDSGSDANHCNNTGTTPIHLAVAPNKECEPVSMKILQMLVIDGHNANVNQPDGSNVTPLYYCCFNSRSAVRRRPEMAKFLLSYGADPHITSNRGFTLLECELKSPDDDSDILKYLVRSMAQPPPLAKLRVVPSTPPTHFNERQYYLDTGVDHNQHRDIYGLMQARNDEQYTPPKVNHPQDEKHLWYESVASNPRTLRHWCRYAIRKALRPVNMKYIRKLPVPSSTQAFLFLETD